MNRSWTARAVVACGLVALGAGAASATPAAPSAEDDDRLRLYLGMWTAHMRRIGGGLDSNGLVGVAAKGFYGATFVNSYGSRAVSAGIQRDVVAIRRGPQIGFRLGLVTGYDERFLGLAGKTPVLPLAQLLARVDHSRFGAEMAYAGLTMSLALSATF